VFPASRLNTTTAEDKYLFRRSHHDVIQERQTMPLLKPPEPQLATRRLYLRIDESLAQTAERYAEFLGTDKLDHVVTQALAFIFKRDAQFKHWLAEHAANSKRLSQSRDMQRKQPDQGAEQ